ncbi:hypothetical protein, partial [Xanthomonas hortorum]|uniref:hypothetical protein n=1 Tax=Xanthomonas hortorum TaxID=56454 RepID=UPI00255AC22B
GRTILPLANWVSPAVREKRSDAVGKVKPRAVHWSKKKANPCAMATATQMAWPALWWGLHNAQVTLPRSALNCIVPCRSSAVTVEASLPGERTDSFRLTEVLAGTTKALTRRMTHNFNRLSISLLALHCCDGLFLFANGVQWPQLFPRAGRNS